MHQNNTSAYLRLHFIIFIWGFTAVLGALISIEAIPLVWHRMWIACLFIFLFLVFTKRTDFKIDKKGWRIILAGMLIAAHWIAFFQAIKISNVSVTLACLSTGAFFGSIIEPIAYKRKPDITEMALGLLVIAGLYLIFRFEGHYAAGIIIALVSAFFSACFSVVNSKLVKSHSPFRITFLEMLGGWLAISVFCLFGLLSGKMQLSNFSLNTTDWLYLLILGSICTAYAFIESVAVMRTLSSFTVLLSVNMEPVYGILLALLVFGQKEKMNGYFYLGATIILFTVVADAFLKRRKRRKSMAKNS